MLQDPDASSYNVKILRLLRQVDLIRLEQHHPMLNKSGWQNPDFTNNTVTRWHCQLTATKPHTTAVASALGETGDLVPGTVRRLSGLDPDGGICPYRDRCSSL